MPAPSSYKESAPSSRSTANILRAGRDDRNFEVFMLGDKEIIAFVGLSNAEKARAFHRDGLGRYRSRLPTRSAR
jgi:hypothetical protein